MDDQTAENLITILTDHPEEGWYDREDTTCGGYLLFGVWMPCGCDYCTTRTFQEYYGEDSTGDHH